LTRELIVTSRQAPNDSKMVEAKCYSWREA